MFFKNVVFSKYSRSELIDTLTRKYDNFIGLDPVTLSRWSKGITTPSLQRQILVAYCTDSINEFVHYYSSPKLPSYLMQTYQSYVEQFDDTYFSLAKDISVQDLFYLVGKQYQLDSINGIYMRKMSFYKKLINQQILKRKCFIYLVEK